MEHHDVSQIKLNILKQLVNLSRRVYIYIYIYLSLSRFVEGHAAIFLWRSAILTAPR
jgi:hypothetical protein